MKTLLKATLFATASLGMVAALPSFAMAQAAPAAPVVGIANLEEAVAKSNAWVLAANQIRITYAPQITAFEARKRGIEAELQPLAAAIQAAQAAPSPNTAAINGQIQQFQGRQQAAQGELQRLYAPIGRAEAFAQEQILTKLDSALKAAMTKRRVGIVLQPQATVSYAPTADITNDIVAELNTSVPQVSIAVPANWQPGGGGAAPAAGAAPAPAGRPAPAVAPRPQPQGR